MEDELENESESNDIKLAGKTGSNSPLARDVAKQAVQGETSVADQAALDQHKDSNQARHLRERFSWVVSTLVFLWMIAIYALLLFEGTHWFLGMRFELSEKVMLAALGTVTLNVIGLLVIILRFVFPED